MEKDKFYLIWYKDDRGQSRHRGIKFLRETSIDVEFENIMNGSIESIFIGTFTNNRGRTKEYTSKEALLSKLREMDVGRKYNGQ